MKNQPWTPNPHFTEQAAALRETILTCKVVALWLPCIVCLTSSPEIFSNSDNPAPSEDEQFERLLDRVAIRGWAVVDYRDKTETKRGLACPSCARIVASPTPPPTRATSTVLLPPFERKKSHRRRAA